MTSKNNVKNICEIIGWVSLKTQENTMRALSDTMMTTLFMEPLEHMDRLVAHIVYESHGYGVPPCTERDVKSCPYMERGLRRLS